MTWLGWRTYLYHWWPGWSMWVAIKGLRLLEWIVMDSELILNAQALSYQEAAVMLEAKGTTDEDLLVAKIYRGVSEGLYGLACDVYVSFK